MRSKNVPTMRAKTAATAGPTSGGTAVDPDIAKYRSYVGQLDKTLRHDEAMEHAIGGSFDAFGLIERDILLAYGLGDKSFLIDVGCGSGRLAKALAEFSGRYHGIDVVPELVEYARRFGRPGWRFSLVDGTAIPEAEESADMICFFSVLTHLRLEQIYLYLEDARRVLRAGGRIVGSFIELTSPNQWPAFQATVADARGQRRLPLNVFLERSQIEVIADRIGLEILDLRRDDEPISARGALGQAIAVFAKP